LGFGVASLTERRQSRADIVSVSKDDIGGGKFSTRWLPNLDNSLARLSICKMWLTIRSSFD
jgi:SET domain-containing protein